MILAISILSCILSVVEIDSFSGDITSVSWALVTSSVAVGSDAKSDKYSAGTDSQNHFVLEHRVQFNKVYITRNNNFPRY